MRDITGKILGASLFVFAFSLVCEREAKAQSCLTPSTCEDLGYKQSSGDCAGKTRVLKCPFDQTKMFCEEELNQEVKIGAILYSDKTVSTEIISGKTPIGVVFDISDRLAIALEASPSKLAWSSGEIDPSELGLEGCYIGDSAVETLGFSYCHTSGKENTAKIIAHGQANNISYPAAEYCYNYTTAGTKKGDWFLPSLSELDRISHYYPCPSYPSVIATLNALGKASIENMSYYSSSVDDDGPMKIYYGSGYSGSSPTQPNYVRPVIAF